MIPKTAGNRHIIIDYLENCNEDNLIENVIIPLFNGVGFSLIRKVPHGPGEHGKDIIFSRFNPAFLDLEYIVVQAKTITITTNNVTDCAGQLIRALQTPITGLNGANQVLPNYVVFITSKRISNDANFEFPYLLNNNNNIKILHQDNLYELMANNSIIPDPIKQKIYMKTDDALTQDQIVETILRDNKPNEVEALFNFTLPTLTEISETTKALIIEYIFYVWNKDKSWDGTVRPMKWLLKYFNYIQPHQYHKLKDVIKEYFSNTPSYAARADTQEVFKLITPEMIEYFKSDYILYVALLINKDKRDSNAFEKIQQIDGTSNTSPQANKLWPLIKEYVDIYFSNDTPDVKNNKMEKARKALKEACSEYDI